LDKFFPYTCHCKSKEKVIKIEKTTQQYFADVIRAIIEKEEKGKLSKKTIHQLKDDVNWLGYK
jgi:hypothetical protein